MNHSHVRHNSFADVTQLMHYVTNITRFLHIRHTTHSHMSHDFFTHHHSHSLFPCHTTHARVPHNSFTYVTQFIYICHAFIYTAQDARNHTLAVHELVDFRIWARGKRRCFSPGASRAPQGSDQSFHGFSQLLSPHFPIFFEIGLHVSLLC